jgi:hypothetical protein
MLGVVCSKMIGIVCVCMVKWHGLWFRGFCVNVATGGSSSQRAFLVWCFHLVTVFVCVFCCPLPSCVCLTSETNMLKRKGESAPAPASKQGKAPVDMALIESTYACSSIFLHVLTRIAYPTVYQDITALACHTYLGFGGLLCPLVPPLPSFRRFDKVENIMEEMDEVEAEIETEILKVHERFWARKHAVLQKRNAALKAIPNFWAKACDNHPSLGQLFNELDKLILQSVESLESDESNPSVGFTLIFHFKPNPFFTNKTLTLQSKNPQDPEEECTITPSPIDWKDKKVRAIAHRSSPSLIS